MRKVCVYKIRVKEVLRAVDEIVSERSSPSSAVELFLCD